MRRLVVPLFVALLAFALVGCGGGEEPAAETPATTPPPAAPSAAVSAADLENITLSSESQEFSVPQFPFPEGEFVNADIQKRLDEKRPMIIFFIDAEQQETDDLRKEVDQVMKKNAGMIDLIIYDLGKYTSVGGVGNISVDESTLTSDKAAARVYTLADKLGVTSAPAVVVVDDQGFVIWRHRGLFESALLDRQVVRTTP